MDCLNSKDSPAIRCSGRSAAETLTGCSLGNTPCPSRAATGRRSAPTRRSTSASESTLPMLPCTRCCPVVREGEPAGASQRSTTGTCASTSLNVIDACSQGTLRRYCSAQCDNMAAAAAADRHADHLLDELFVAEHALRQQTARVVACLCVSWLLLVVSKLLQGQSTPGGKARSSAAKPASSAQHTSSVFCSVRRLNSHGLNAARRAQVLEARRAYIRGCHPPR